jgi:hypothetical protein
MTQKIALDVEGKSQYHVLVSSGRVGDRATVKGKVLELFIFSAIEVPVEQARELAHAILKEIGDE